MYLFDVCMLCCKGGKDVEIGYDFIGDYFGLFWLCYGMLEFKYFGLFNLYDISKYVMEGGGNFCVNFGVECDGVNLLVEDGLFLLGLELMIGYFEFDYVFFKKLGWWDDLIDVEKKVVEGKNWKIDLLGGIQCVVMKYGCYLFGNVKVCVIVWNFLDGILQYCELLYLMWFDMVVKYFMYDDKKVFWCLFMLYKIVQQCNIENKVYEKFLIIFIFGCLVEYEGGGEEMCFNLWFVELQQENFVEINLKVVVDCGICYNDFVWVKMLIGVQIKVCVLVMECVGVDYVFILFYFLGWWQGKDLFDYYLEGVYLIVCGEVVNMVIIYGYDLVMMMQEMKMMVCQIEWFV